MKNKKIIISILSFVCLLGACKSNKTVHDSETQAPSINYFFDSSNISIEGRYIANEDHSTTLSSAASNARFKVAGASAQLIVSAEFEQAFIDVLVDGQVAYKSYSLNQNPDTIKINLGGNTNDPHLVEIYTRGEGDAAAARLIQLETEKSLINVPKPNRKLMFIGASVTCGAVAEPGDNCVISQASHNGRVAHGTLIAHDLNAESQLICRSGRGILNGSVVSIPQDAEHFIDYTLTTPSGPIYWDHRQFIPQGIVVALGNNDNLNNADLFITNYNSLLFKLRTLYPDAIILLTEGPLISGDRKNLLTSYLTSIVETGSDNNVRYIPSKKYPNSPCNDHPDAKTHQQIAEELLPLIKENLNW
ncbi:MAG TPA: hypothetical protein VIZ65_17480 [Cellvibrionaceae bacterium]